MGVHALKEGEKYRVAVDGLGTAGKRRTHSEVIWGTEEDARRRNAELLVLRDRALLSIRHRAVLLPPVIYTKLKQLAGEVGMTPDDYVAFLIEEMP